MRSAVWPPASCMTAAMALWPTAAMTATQAPATQSVAIRLAALRWRMAALCVARMRRCERRGVLRSHLRGVRLHWGLVTTSFEDEFHWKQR